MEIQELKYFMAVCEEMSYSKAAERLYVTRQALSRRIHSLEDEIGAKLFDYVDGRLSVTLAGEKLLLKAPGVLNAMAHLEREMHVGESGRKKIRVVIGQGTFNMLPADVFFDFGKTQENMDVSLIERLDSDARELLYSLFGDIGILRTYPSMVSMFDYDLIQKQTIFFRVHKDNPLAGKKMIETDDLKTQHFASLGMRNDEHRFLVSECHKYGFEPDVILETGDAHSAGQIVLSNRGIAFGFPEAEEVHGHPDIVLRPWKVDDSPFGLYMIRVKKHMFPREAMELLEYLKEFLREGQKKRLRFLDRSGFKTEGITIS